ncbi:MAG: DinB family protein, partial [Flavobacterium sp.]
MENIRTEAEQTLQSFIKTFSEFKQETVNLAPFKGSWTAGQVAEHMILANSNFGEVLNGLVEETQRKPDEKVEVIRSILLNFDTKLDSPDFICPVLKDYDRKFQLEKLIEIKDEILET